MFNFEIKQLNTDSQHRHNSISFNFPMNGLRSKTINIHFSNIKFFPRDVPTSSWTSALGYCLKTVKWKIGWIRAILIRRIAHLISPHIRRFYRRIRNYSGRRSDSVCFSPGRNQTPHRLVFWQPAGCNILDLHTSLTHAKTKRLLHNLRATCHVMQPRATIKKVIYAYF